MKSLLHVVEVTKSLSNLLKSRNIVCDGKGKKVIDYNELISEKIYKIQEAIAKEHRETSEYELVDGIDAESVERLLTEVDETDRHNMLQNKADDIISLANEDAKVIIERAKQESDLIRTDSATVGWQEGYEEGKKQAEIEILKLKKEIEDERVQMEIEYNDSVQQIEPMLVNAILTVFERVTHVLAEDKKDLVLHLVNDVLSKTEISKEFLIRVSNADYKFMLDNRDRITGVVSKKVQIEIIEDPTFKKGQCMIESDSGIYDCSLDIQLDNLINAIKVMTCLVNE